MSKRAELHKEYYKQHGTRKGTAKVSEHYVKWLEDKVLGLRTEAMQPTEKYGCHGCMYFSACGLRMDYGNEGCDDYKPKP